MYRCICTMLHLNLYLFLNLKFVTSFSLSAKKAVISKLFIPVVLKYFFDGVLEFLIYNIIVNILEL